METNIVTLKTKRFLSQTLTMLLVAMTLLVAGTRSSSGHYDVIKKVSASIPGDQDPGDMPGGDQAMVSSLSLDAVITPALSFDFCQYFYFIPPAVWQFVATEVVRELSSERPLFLTTGFARIFGKYIVTNAP